MASTITSRLAGNVLDTEGGKLETGVAVIVNTKGKSPSQQWLITGEGFIAAASKPDLVLEVTKAGGKGASVALANKKSVDSAANQLWKVEKSGTISNQGLVLDIGGGGTAAGARLIVWEANGNINQQWTVAKSSGRPVRKNFYKFYGLSADFSTTAKIDNDTSAALIRLAIEINKKQEKKLPNIDESYTAAQIEKENKEWWPTHCEALRKSRGDILGGEYRPDLVYFCSDGPYQGTVEQAEREQHWWALIAQPGVTMAWPLVMFSGDVVYFEWKCVDDFTNETIGKGSVTWIRRGHRGGCSLKTEQLTFYRDVYAPKDLLDLLQ